MKYLQQGGFQNNPHMRLTLGLALVLLAAFWVSNAALYFAHMNLDPASVVAYYRGDEARFMAPRSAESLLEVTHMHLPMFALVLLLLTHLLVFAPMHDARKTVMIVTAFGSALLMEAAGWLTRFVHPGFAWLKVAAFLVFQLVLGGLIVGLGLFVARGQRKRRRGHGHPPGHPPQAGPGPGPGS
ncbi:MAG TPA: hypothetical protein VI504_09670 [Candidatus Eisenbacteria bacterium]|jgi:hypothetical protein